MKVIYNHPSVPKNGIKVYKRYDLDYVKTLYENYKKYFKPVDGEWEKKVIKKKLEKVEVENKEILKEK